jgi:translation initiation factor IF-1
LARLNRSAAAWRGPPILAEGPGHKAGSPGVGGQQETTPMSKEEFIEFEGVITELLPEGRFRVQLDNEHTILAYTAGRMKRNRIRSLVGDRVTVEMTPYDLEKGRITYRHKTEGPRMGGGQQRPQFRRR